jgi:hypothetical protein
MNRLMMMNFLFILLAPATRAVTVCNLNGWSASPAPPATAVTQSRQALDVKWYKRDASQPKNVKCYKLFTAPSNSVLEITFSSFNTLVNKHNLYGFNAVTEPPSNQYTFKEVSWPPFGGVNKLKSHVMLGENLLLLWWLQGEDPFGTCATQVYPGFESFLTVVCAAEYFLKSGMCERFVLWLS